MIEKKKSGRNSKKPTEAELSMLYSQMTAREIAQKYEVAESTVRKWIGEYRRESRDAEKNRQ